MLGQQKKPKSTILVIGVIIGLLFFIILPPVLRATNPKPVEEPEVKKKSTILSCERVSALEKTRTTSKTTFEDGQPVEAKLMYSKYEPSEDEIVKANTDKGDDDDKETVVARELEKFKKLTGISYAENTEGTTVIINMATVSANPNDLEVANYMLTLEQEMSFLKNKGFKCSVTNID